MFHLYPGDFFLVMVHKPHLLAATALILVVASVSATNVTDTEDSLNVEAVRVINGDPVTDKQEYEFVVDLSTNPDKVSTTRFCTGTLLRPNIVLTAAHCALNHGETGPGTFATVGRINLKDSHVDNNDSQTFHCDAGLVHPSYAGLGSPADVALLLLDGTSSKQLVRLSHTTPRRHTQAWIVGYGIQVFGTVEETGEAVEVMPSRLQKTALRIERRHFCDIPGAIQTSKGMLCTAGIHPGSSACRGDSGGGLFMEEENRKVQVGIVSYGDAMCRSKDSGVFTDIAAVYDWIQAAADQLQDIANQAQDLNIVTSGRTAVHKGHTLPANGSDTALARAVIHPSLRYFRLKVDSERSQNLTVNLCMRSATNQLPKPLFLASKNHNNLKFSVHNECSRSDFRGYRMSFDAQKGTHILGVASEYPSAQYELAVESETERMRG